MTDRTYELGPDVPADEPVYDSHGNLIDEDYIARAVNEAHEAIRGRPSLSGDTGSSPRLSFRVPHDVREAAERIAHEEGVSVSTLARRALEERVRKAHRRT